VETDSCGAPHALQMSARDRTRRTVARGISKLQGRAAGIQLEFLHGIARWQ
jgi:hypothetical protein